MTTPDIHCWGFFFFLRQKTLVWGVKVKELEGEAKVWMEARAGFCGGCVLSDGAAVKVQNTLAHFFGFFPSYFEV